MYILKDPFQNTLLFGNEKEANWELWEASFFPLGQMWQISRKGGLSCLSVYKFITDGGVDDVP